MSDGQSLRDRSADLDGLPPRQRPLGQPAAEGLAFQQFHDDIGNGVLRIIVVDSEDVRVGERGKRLGLAFKASESFGIACKGLGLDFHGDLAPEPRIASAVHFPHAARAERSHNFVRPKPARDYEHARRLLQFRHEGALRFAVERPPSPGGARSSASWPRYRSSRPLAFCDCCWWRCRWR